jgi:formylglycine-generating enzyme required for sulfatase activity
MGRFVLLVSILARVTAISPAQTITETFGTGANAFTMDFVQIGNPGNTADMSVTSNLSPYPPGSVAYTYNLGKYEVSSDMINKANTAGVLNITLSDWGANKPALGISWYEAARFVNYLNTSTGNTAAYKFNSSNTFQIWSPGELGYDSNNPFRNSLSKFFLPSRDEWYKGAYGSPGGAYSDYPSSTTIVVERSSWQGPDDIDLAGGLSAYGTMAQGGNANEWTESAFDGINDFATEVRLGRGGFYNDPSWVSAYKLNTWYFDPSIDDYRMGFRVASVPEPSSLSLLALGSLVMAVGIRRRS